MSPCAWESGETGAPPGGLRGFCCPRQSLGPACPPPPRPASQRASAVLDGRAFLPPLHWHVPHAHHPACVSSHARGSGVHGSHPAPPTAVFMVSPLCQPPGEGTQDATVVSKPRVQQQRLRISPCPDRLGSGGWAATRVCRGALPRSGPASQRTGSSVSPVTGERGAEWCPAALCSHPAWSTGAVTRPSS